MPTASAASLQLLPANNIRPARKHFLVASVNRSCAMPILSSVDPEDVPQHSIIVTKYGNVNNRGTESFGSAAI